MPKKQKESIVSGHSTTTYKFRFYIKELEYLKLTNKIYNKIVENYYNLLLIRNDLLELSNHNCLRELELLTVKPKTGERKGLIPEFYFEQENAPIYLRRAAINTAIGLARAWNANQNANKTTNFNLSTVFYKGMYKNLEDGKIQIKLFDGNHWKWYQGKLKDWKIPKGAEILSPTVVIQKDYVMLHIPIKTFIEDVTPIKNRMERDNIRICGIVFPNSNTDTFSVCIVLDGKGKFIKSLFIKGANEYRHRVNKLNNKIRKHRKVNPNYSDEDHKNDWNKIDRIKNHYAHKISKQIVDFCKQNQVQVIAKPNYKEIKEKNEHTVIFYETKNNRNNPVGLSMRILKILHYKAYKEGILMTGVVASSITNRCYKCGGLVRRKLKQTDYTLKLRCENGHTGDYYFNAAMNVGIRCLKKFGREIQTDKT